MVLVFEKEEISFTPEKEDLMDSTQIIYGDDLLKMTKNDLPVLDFNSLSNETIEDIIVDILYEKMDFKGACTGLTSEKSFSSSLLLPLTEIVSDNLDFIAELAFEKLNFPVIGFEHPSICSLIANGQITGLVMDLGYTSTRYSGRLTGGCLRCTTAFC